MTSPVVPSASCPRDGGAGSSLPARRPAFVLASASPRRRELLAGAGVAFRVDPADADESIPPGTPPEQAAVDLALRKARIVRERTDLPVLAADTLVVAADGGVLGKPAGTEEALSMLRRLSGTTHRVLTGVALLTPRGERTACDVTFVTMRPVTEAEAVAYAASGEPFGKAGGYAIQETGDRFVTEVRGSWSNVVGLPVEVVVPWLREEGIS